MVHLLYWICRVIYYVYLFFLERVLKLMDYYEGSFQDFASHDNAVSLARYTLDGTRLVTAAHGQILVWDVLI